MKKIFVSVLITVAAMLSALSVFAEWDTTENILSLLNGLKIMEGDGSGNYRLDDYVSRAEFAKLVVSASSAKDTVATGLKISPYKDVKYTDWFAPYVHAAVNGGLCEGYIDGTFHPNDNVTYEEAVTMVLRALGYTDEDFGVSWPYGQIGMAQNLEITKQVNSSIGEPLTRGQVARMLYNALDTKQKNNSLDTEVEELIRQRNEARAAKDWATADAIRDKLKEMNIVLKDTPDGVKWSIVE